VNEWLYVPTHAGGQRGQQFNNSLRVTYQVNPKVKIAGTYKADKWCNCPNQISATARPRRRATGASRVCRRSMPRSPRRSPTSCLFEAVGLHLFERWGDMHLRGKGGSLDDPCARGPACRS
jgi:hypothetical protein